MLPPCQVEVLPQPLVPWYNPAMSVIDVLGLLLIGAAITYLAEGMAMPFAKSTPLFFIARGFVALAVGGALLL